ncbi:MAG: isoprenylcysteine carboxylmethyltransferase family protein [Candidatus Latescibacteria bacterium]|nr:isoprenylcysteine carboxylmethyltransferase family protein [Candidatus Latescibacterota bacterium]NIO56235.1 isoprenylcysteine carboxylmethyltransferase family protein [Candidatus Latescibacterota bacterium]
MFELIVFVVVSAALVYLSRRSLRAPRSHGFYRFFAAEFVLILVLLNWDDWFQDPFASRQAASWLLLAVSIALVVHGAYLLKVVGKPDSRRSDEVPLAGIEKTTSLVSVGAYKYIRHPIYGSGFYGTWGVFLKDPSWPGMALALAATVFWVITARTEEAECIQYFGATYRVYMKRTKMFVPFLF